MNDALIVRVTGCETVSCSWKRLNAVGLFLTRMDDPGEWFSLSPAVWQRPAPALPVGAGD